MHMGEWSFGLGRYINKTLLDVLNEFGVAEIPLLRELCDAACQITVQTSTAANPVVGYLDFFFAGQGTLRAGLVSWLVLW